jgi:hypothetical protein
MYTCIKHYTLYSRNRVHIVYNLTERAEHAALARYQVPYSVRSRSTQLRVLPTEYSQSIVDSGVTDNQYQYYRYCNTCTRNTPVLEYYW